MDTLVGRKYEQELLTRIVESGNPEFLAVYGRRRVGKTFLIKQFFQNNFTFYFSGVESASMKKQLENFKLACQNCFDIVLSTPESWSTAFALLQDILSKSKKKGRKVIFIDELPWLATNGAGFIQAFEYFWNTYASANPDMLMIVCGSSTSWIINKIIKNRGGLHNRVTRQMQLTEFSLSECEEFVKSRKLLLDRKQIADYYAIIGGIPYYWQQLDKALGLPQNIDNLFFRKNGILRNEFEKIYNSLFKHSEKYIQIVTALGEKRMGLTREEIIRNTKLLDGGSVTRILEELEQCGFVRAYTNFGKKRKDKLYQLVDFFSLFHLNFIAHSHPSDESYWTNILNTPKYHSWIGYSFEQLCLAHIHAIRIKLGISGVLTYTSSWRSRDGARPVSTENSAQIDLVIDRNDRIINLCEMKYAADEFVITKSINDNLRKKRAAFMSETKTRKTVHTTMVTTYGVKHNEYWGNIQSEVIMDDLFV
ncbi:ATPase [Bacteroidia bacterium]|nr:ATPase [Bacteroidia bacterium]